MALIEFFILQVLSYGVLPWCAFIAITLLAARFLGWPGVVIGHIVIALFVSKLDYAWVQSEMSKPDWDGVPDMDIVFSVGCFIHTVMVNTTLLPIAILICRWRSRRVNRPFVAAY